MDWVAAVLELAGLWMVGNKNRAGFVLLACCCVAWYCHVLTSESTYGLLIVVTPALFINVRNWRKWRQHGET